MRLSVFLLVLGLCACGQKPDGTQAAAPPAAEAAPDDPAADMKDDTPVVVMLGDSLTAGYNLPAGNALPAALQRAFNEDGVKAKFVNAGVSGDTTADGLNRYDWSVTGTNAAVLVVALGANDFLQGVAPEIPKKNLAAILTRAKEDDIAAVLVGVQIPGDGPNGQNDAREAAYAAIYPALAKEFDVPYFSNMLAPVAGKAGLLQQDGLHPTADGVEAMAGELASFLEPLVKDLP
ncbi:MAG TPA: arylesterase [Hyphomonadaceae bacterium]|jgi:acyl-CoA thioesterase-1|nr:arylesterase [Hyphomonadaceae bacterium]